MDASLEMRLSPLLAGAPGVLAVYLFGSAARQQLRERSDVDVGVLFATKGGLDRCLVLEEPLERAIGRRVQVVDLESAPADLVQRVFRDGVLLVDRDRAARVRFEVRRLNEWFDLQPLLRAYRGARGAA